MCRKGVLTGAAVVMMANWPIFIALVWIFVLALAFSKIVSLSSITAAAFLPILTLFYSPGPCYADFLLSFLISVLIVLKHKGNIVRIVKKEEKRIFR
ncbi:MAG: glycerol-3-phosphate acyltransferase [Oscillospiraceae bacterium]|nr:glycerol-3-phosphate acyltransferase [Oscillospiraceae bacterium]